MSQNRLLSFAFGRLAGSVLVAASLLCAFSPSARAQLGTGWIPTSFTKSIHLDDEAGLQTFSWAASRSVCTPVCADYAYTSASDTETFRIFDSRSNRSEIRLQNNYTSGIWQFEGYVNFDSPLHDESLFQIFGNNGPAATFLMMRGYRDNAGTIRVMGGSHTIASGIYGDEVRINVIHQHNVSAKFYVNGQFIYEKPHNDPGVTNYWKYGVYGTTNGNVPAIVQWRAVRTFRDGLPPEANETPLGAIEAEYALLSGPVIASSQPGYTGNGFVDYMNNSGDYVQWTITAPEAGLFDLGFRYALQSGNRPLSIQLDGQYLDDSLAFDSTGSWQNWAYSSIRSVYLSPGTHTIRATAAGLSGPNMDHLLVEAGWAADLDRNGAVGANDWQAFKSGRGVNMANMTLEQTYFLGDLNGDRQHDLFDFLKFRQSYEAANGEGSFVTMLAVPEPATWSLFLIAWLPAVLARRSRRWFTARSPTLSNRLWHGMFLLQCR
jgi:hypothetical protein